MARKIKMVIKAVKAEESDDDSWDEEPHFLLCGVGDSNLWTPKGCRAQITDAYWIEDGRGTVPYCKECHASL